MTRQTPAPIDHISLNPSFVTASELVKQIDRGELTLDPPYQRGQVWTGDQRIALVQTWLRGLPAGVVILADRCAPAWSKANPDRDPNTHMDEPWWACVDGKQRLTTARMWFHGEFAVPATWFPADHVDTTSATQDGPYVRYTGLTRKGHLFMDRYASLLVAKAQDCATEADEATFYLLVNGGGTPQTDADMANAARVAVPAYAPPVMPDTHDEYLAMRDADQRPANCPQCPTSGPVPHWPSYYCRSGNGPGKPIRAHCTCDLCF